MTTPIAALCRFVAKIGATTYTKTGSSSDSWQLIFLGIDVAMASVRDIIVPFHCTEEVLAMRKVLIAAFCAIVLSVMGGQATAQENKTPEKDKSVVDKTTDKAKDVKDKTVEGTKAAGEKTKDVIQETGDKAEDAKDKTVKGAKVAGKKTKEVANEAGDKAEDVKDKSAKGVKVATKETKEVGEKAADTAGDVKDKSVKGAKKSGNWLTRTFKKIF